MFRSCIMVGAPVQAGVSQFRCMLGHDAFHTADLAGAVHDHGSLRAAPPTDVHRPNPARPKFIRNVAWAEALALTAYETVRACTMTIFLRGDHSLSIEKTARAAFELSRDQFVLWLGHSSDVQVARYSNKLGIRRGV